MKRFELLIRAALVLLDVPPETYYNDSVQSLPMMVLLFSIVKTTIINQINWIRLILTRWKLYHEWVGILG
jgi:hypothetical protein